MGCPPRRRALATLASVLLVLAPVPSARAGGRASYDYRRIGGLSAPRYQTRREIFERPMRDGVRLHVEVVHPEAAGRFPVILKASPYHGDQPGGEDREGSLILPGNDTLAGYFAPRGYHVAFVDLRGSGASGGCFDELGAADQRDLYDIVEFLAAQPWSNGRVGMIGVSYPAGAAITAAAQHPPHLATIVPIAGFARMYDHQFQGGVPYFLQWLGPAGVYDTFSAGRQTDPAMAPYAGCGLPNSALTTGDALASGVETAWHRERDVHADATGARIPMFVIAGVNDASIRTPALEWFHARRRAGDKLWLGQWGHEAPPRGDQWLAALHAWFDHHLQSRPVPTGPAVEMFLDGGRVAQAPAWPVRTRPLVLDTTANGGLGAPTATATTLPYVADATGFAAELTTGHVSFDSAPMRSDTLLAGVPTLRLTVAVTSPRVDLIATVYDVDGSTVTRIGEGAFAVRPELRDGITTAELVTPGQPMTMTLRGMVMAHLVRAGHRIRLAIASSHPDKVPAFAGGAVVIVTAGGRDATRLTLPVADHPALLADVQR